MSLVKNENGSFAAFARSGSPPSGKLDASCGLSKREYLVAAQAPAMFTRLSDGFVSEERAGQIAMNAVMLADVVLAALDGEPPPADGGAYRTVLRHLLEQIETCRPVDEAGHDFISNQAVRDARILLGQQELWPVPPSQYTSQTGA